MGVWQMTDMAVNWSEWAAHKNDAIEQLMLKHEFALAPHALDLRALARSLRAGDEVADLELERILASAGVPFVEWRRLNEVWAVESAT